MNSGAGIVFGIFVALAASWWGMIVAPRLQLGDAPTVVIKTTGQHYPPTRPGLAQQGAEVYRAAGCNACHTQLVRPEGFGSDIQRDWGQRRSVAQDYLRDQPVMLGTTRIGPDLTNIGARMGSGNTNIQPVMVAYHLKHLYHPRTVVPGSVMPAYPYFFEQQRVGEFPAPDALKLEGEFAPPPDYQIVPKPEARALVAYLLSLRSEVSLPEAPLIPPPTNSVASPTNNVPTATNSVPPTTNTVRPTNQVGATNPAIR